MEVVRYYNLVQAGIDAGYNALDMPAGLSDAFIDLHTELKLYEADEMERSTKSNKKW